jgi:hypothetical protein
MLGGLTGHSGGTAPELHRTSLFDSALPRSTPHL